MVYPPGVIDEELLASVVAVEAAISVRTSKPAGDPIDI
jgi:hypothetical protein